MKRAFLKLRNKMVEVNILTESYDRGVYLEDGERYIHLPNDFHDGVKVLTKEKLIKSTPPAKQAGESSH